MRKTKEVQVGDRKITINELTVAQVDALFSGFDAERPAHKAELLMESALPIEAVERNPDQPRKHFDEPRLAELVASPEATDSALLEAEEPQPASRPAAIATAMASASTCLVFFMFV